MPNIRLMLWGVLAAILFLNYQTWLHDYETPSRRPPRKRNAGSRANALGAGEHLGDDALPHQAPSPAPTARCLARPPGATPAGRRRPLSASAAPAASAAEAPPQRRCTSAPTCSISTSISKAANSIRPILKEYPLRKDTPNIPVRLFSYEPPPTLYLLQSGLIGAAGEAAPTHLAVWKSEQKSFALAPGANELRVPLTWTRRSGPDASPRHSFSSAASTPSGSTTT